MSREKGTWSQSRQRVEADLQRLDTEVELVKGKVSDLADRLHSRIDLVGQKVGSLETKLSTDIVRIGTKVDSLRQDVRSNYDQEGSSGKSHSLYLVIGALIGAVVTLFVALAIG